MSTATQAAAVVTAAAAAIPAALAASPASAAQAPGQAPAFPGTYFLREMPPAKSLVTKIISEAAGKTYTIESGDTLSGIARRFCGKPADWTGIWQQNKAEIRDPDVVLPGQKVRFTCEEISRLLGAADSGGAGNPGYQSQGSQSPVVTDAVSGYYGNVDPASFSGFEQCVITRESGGQSQVMNSTEHYGLFQFSASTWAAYGGNPADFGHASVAEQERVYENVVAAGATYGTWSEWDGC